MPNILQYCSTVAIHYTAQETVFTVFSQLLFVFASFRNFLAECCSKRNHLSHQVELYHIFNCASQRRSHTQTHHTPVHYFTYEQPWLPSTICVTCDQVLSSGWLRAGRICSVSGIRMENFGPPLSPFHQRWKYMPLIWFCWSPFTLVGSLCVLPMFSVFCLCTQVELTHLSACRDALWGLDTHGRVSIRTLSPSCPFGLHWTPLDLSQLGMCHTGGGGGWRCKVHHIHKPGAFMQWDLR